MIIPDESSSDHVLVISHFNIILLGYIWRLSCIKYEDADPKY